MGAGTDLVPGDVLDKYRLERLLGRGGMGEVWAAHDPDLDRRIALKVLNRSLADDDDAHARLQREGRAMARLRHANVITVHDAMFSGGRGLIAMEMIDGESLAAYLVKRRPPDEIMRVLLAAGRGLAAAHGAGMIHRDFKPHNVLIDRDGRVLVTDFGLARSSGDSIPPPAEPPAEPPAAAPADPAVMPTGVDGDGATLSMEPAAPAPPRATGDDSGWKAIDAGAETVAAAALEATALSPSPAGRTPSTPSGKGDLSTPLTETGMLLGTPAYMAPEQLAGRSADARADQFAFCVTAWEAFAGERPFRGKTVAEITAAVDKGEPGAIDRIPRRLRALILRGLARDPAARWPGMAELLAALQHAWSRPYRIRRAAIAGGVALAAAAAIVVVARRGEAPIAGCTDADAALAPAWSPAIRADLATRLAAGRTADPGEAERALRFYDRWADKWKRTRIANCKKPADPDFAARRACLDSILDEVATKLDLRADVPIEVYRADHMSIRLPAPETCMTDPRNLPPAPPADPATRAAVRAIRVQLERAHAAFSSITQLASGVDVTDAVRAARETRYPPVISEALLADGIVQYIHSSGDLDGCAGIAAAASDADLLGYQRQYVEASLIHAECLRGATGTATSIMPRLEATARRAGHPILIAAVEVQLAVEAVRIARYDEALARLERAHAIYRDHDLVGSAAVALADAAHVRLLRDRGDDLDRASEMLRSIETSPAVDPDFVTHVRHDIEWRRGAVDTAPALPAADTELDLRRPVTLSITVVDEHGPVAGAAIAAGTRLTGDPTRLAMPEVGGAAAAITGADGTAVVVAPYGSMVIARADTRAGAVAAQRDTGPVTITLGPAGELSGEVTGLDPTAPDPSDEAGRVARRILPVVFLHTDLGEDLLSWKVPIDHTGHWHVSGLIPGEYLIAAQARTSLGDTQSAQTTVDVAAGAAVAPTLAFPPHPPVITVVQPEGEGHELVIAMPATGKPPPSTWRQLWELMNDAPFLARARFRPAGPDDPAKPGDRIARLPGGERATVVCSAVGMFVFEDQAIGILGPATDTDPPVCVSQATARAPLVTLSR